MDCARNRALGSGTCRRPRTVPSRAECAVTCVPPDSPSRQVSMLWLSRESSVARRALAPGYRRPLARRRGQGVCCHTGWRARGATQAQRRRGVQHAAQAPRRRFRLAHRIQGGWGHRADVFARGIEPPCRRAGHRTECSRGALRQSISTVTYWRLPSRSTWATAAVPDRRPSVAARRDARVVMGLPLTE